MVNILKQTKRQESLDKNGSQITYMHLDEMSEAEKS